MSEETKIRVVDVEGAAGAFEQLGIQTKEQKETEKARQIGFMNLFAPQPVERDRMIKLSQLIESKKNHRKDFGDLTGLGESMTKQGQLTSLIVQKVNPNVFEIVSGARRFRAAKKAELTDLRCDVYEEISPEQAAELRVAENLERKDLKPIEEAENLEELTKLGYSNATLAARFKRTTSWVAGRLKLLKLCPKARALLYESKLPGSVALPLARIPTADLQEKALKRMEEFALRILSSDDVGEHAARWENEHIHCNARKAIAFLQDEFTKSLKSTPFDQEDEQLVEGVPACKRCPKNSDNMEDVDAKEAPHAFCTDTTCFKSKADAAWKITSAKAEEKGATVLTVSESKSALTANRIDSRFVKASERAFEDPKGRTWSQLVGELPKEAQPAVVVAAGDDKKPVRLYDRSEVEKALADGGFKWADKKRAAKAKGPSPEKLKSETEKRQRLERVSVEALRKAVDTMRSKPANVGALRLLALTVLELEDPYELRQAIEPSIEGDGIASLFGLKSRNDLKSWITKKAKLGDLFAFIFVMVAGNDFANAYGGYSATVKETAALFKIDLKKLEKLDEQARAKPEAEAAAKGEAKS